MDLYIYICIWKYLSPAFSQMNGMLHWGRKSKTIIDELPVIDRIEIFYEHTFE